MDISEILSLPQDQWLAELQIDPVTGRNIQANIDYYDGKHAILTDPDRKDYTIDKWEIDPETNQPKVGSNGQKIAAAPETIKRTRLVLNYQQQIIDTAVGMCVGNPVTLTLNNADESGHSEAFEIFEDQWRNKTRLDTFSKGMSRSLFKESMCAEVFFIDPKDEDKDIKVKLLSKENGDDIWAHFNDDGSLDAITRKFTKRALADGKAEDVEIVQIWTAEKLYTQTNGSDFDENKNPYGKIPIVYYDQKYPEFHIIKELITKQEYVRSQNSDVNKRIGNPNVVVTGDLVDTPDVDQDVKVWNAKPTQDQDGKLVNSKVEYLQLDGAPAAIEAELKAHNQDMYKLTWPDLSFLRDSIKTGTLSGTAIKLMFTDAFVKIGNKREIYEDFSRRVSIMKRMLAVSTGKKVFDELNISVTFNSILPENLSELTSTLSEAVSGKITSEKQAQQLWTGNNNNPNVGDEIEEEQGIIGGVGG